VGVEEETSLLTRYCFSLISLGTYALRLRLVCVVDVRVRLRSSVGILEEALDLTTDLCKALFLHYAPPASTIAQYREPPKNMIIEKALLSGPLSAPRGLFTVALVLPSFSPNFSPLSLRRGVAVVCFEVTIGDWLCLVGWRM